MDQRKRTRKGGHVQILLLVSHINTFGFGYLAPRCHIDKPHASLNNLINGGAISTLIQLPKRIRG